jgi:sarcosine oxidase, subunit beta
MPLPTRSDDEPRCWPYYRQIMASNVPAGASEVPSSAAVVIIGGGVIGTSVAFNLAQAGVSDVVLIERNTLASGSTSKAAGGVRASFSHPVNIKMGMRGLEVYSRFFEDFGQDIEFRRNGYLYLLDNETDMSVFAESVAIQNANGVRSEMINPARAKEISPLIETDGLLGAAWSPDDACATPEGVVMGYARAARELGVKIVQNCAVSAIEVSNGAISAVVTDGGTITTSTVVCAAGAWSKVIGEMVGFDLPVSPKRRQIGFTQPSSSLPRHSPLTIDFSSSFYFHPEGEGLMFGWADPDEPTGFNLEFDLDGWLPRFAPVVERRVPSLFDMGISTGWAGLYEVTPDENQIIGRSADVDGLLYATGFSGHGFLMGPATGEIICDLVLDREPRYDISSFDVRRFLVAPTGRSEHNIV